MGRLQPDSVSNVELRKQRGQGRVQPLIQRAKLAIATRRGSVGVGFDSSPSPRHPVGGRDDVPFPAHSHSRGGQDGGTECRRLGSGRDFDGPLEGVREDAHPQAALGSPPIARMPRVTTPSSESITSGACGARRRCPRGSPGTYAPVRAVLAARPMLPAPPHPSRASRHASGRAGTAAHPSPARPWTPRPAGVDLHPRSHHRRPVAQPRQRHGSTCDHGLECPEAGHRAR